MTVNDLAAAVQNGDTELMPQLWESVQRFVYGRALAMMQHIPPSYGVTVEDLVQSGYFALLSALERFDPDQGSFLTVLSWCLSREFAVAGGYAKTPDPVTSALSLDAPANGDEDNDPFVDFLTAQRPDGGDDYTDADDRIFTQQLHEALEQEISKLPQAQQDAIRGRYWDGRTLTEMAKEAGITPAAMRCREKDGLRKIKYSDAADNLRQFIELRTDYYLHTSVASYQRGAPSSVEQAVLRREKLESRWKSKHEIP